MKPIYSNNLPSNKSMQERDLMTAY